MKKNMRLWMHTLNRTVWYPFSLLWSSISCYRVEMVSYKYPICSSGKITTVPRLFLKHSLQSENKHQIMNVHTKWNCLILILSSLDNFKGWKNIIVSLELLMHERVGLIMYWASLKPRSRVCSADCAILIFHMSEKASALSLCSLLQFLR